MELLLDQLGEPNGITAAVSGSDVLQGKPHPEVFQKAAEKLDIVPTACAVIEDAAAGITAANAAGGCASGASDADATSGSSAEGAGAATLAALLKDVDLMVDKKVAVVLSGGNIDMNLYGAVLAGD